MQNFIVTLAVEGKLVLEVVADTEEQAREVARVRYESANFGSLSPLNYTVQSVVPERVLHGKRD